MDDDRDEAADRSEISKVAGLKPDFGLAAFKGSQVGRQVDILMSAPDVLPLMKAHCEAGIPAVQGLCPMLRVIGVDLTSTSVKQHVGRWVREVMLSDGWVPIRSARVSPGNGFSTGAVYAARPR